MMWLKAKQMYDVKMYVKCFKRIQGSTAATIKTKNQQKQNKRNKKWKYLYVFFFSVQTRHKVEKSEMKEEKWKVLKIIK